MLQRRRAVRAVPLAGVLATVGLLGVVAPPASLTSWTADPGARLRAVGPDAALLDLFAGVAWLAVAWLGLTVGLTALRAVPGRTGAIAAATLRRVSPLLLRRAADSLLALGLVAGGVTGTAGLAAASPTVPATTASTALASPLDRPDESPTPPPPRTVDWPAAPGPPPVGLVATGPTRSADVPEPLVVRRGDTLWGLAERHLGPSADPAAVAAAWPRWHEANRAVIGDDPGLLLPGQQLRPPR
jgi:nucleoid-associated protein YgaU